MYNTSENDDNGLYRATDPDNAEPLLKKIVNSRPSVTDDGKYAVFVGTDNKLYATVVDPGIPSKTILLEPNPIWSNVAISKDGTLLAAITLNKEDSINVYSFDLEKWMTFPLYNPTYSDVRSYTVQYPDALEWDYTGERIIYDAYNVIPSSSGDSIKYWDINLIDVFDKETNQFGDGNIFKLITGLKEGESIGNPSFSKLHLTL